MIPVKCADFSTKYIFRGSLLSNQTERQIYDTKMTKKCARVIFVRLRVFYIYLSMWRRIPSYRCKWTKMRIKFKPKWFGINRLSSNNRPFFNLTNQPIYWRKTVHTLIASFEWILSMANMMIGCHINDDYLYAMRFYSSFFSFLFRLIRTYLKWKIQFDVVFCQNIGFVWSPTVMIHRQKSREVIFFWDIS